MIKVSVVGAKGRMGSHVVDAVNNAADTELALALDAGDDLTQITPGNTDVVVEFTVPSVSLDNVLALVAQGVDVVVGTTGWTDEKLDQVRAALAAAPREGQSVFIAPNFAISAVLADYFAKVAAPYFESAEVIELHHPNKVDAPSGTALSMGEVVAKTLGRDLKECAVYGREGITGERDRNTIGFATIRAGDLVGEHTVMFADIGERVEISHKASSRLTFANGAVRAGKWLGQQGAGLYDMQDVLDLK